jgi:hypothetical protein
MPETPEVQQDQVPEVEPQPDGVFVGVRYGDDGTVAVEVQQVGSVRVTEVLTILEQAVRSTRQSMGLPG